MRVNGGSNYEYPEQRWAPKLVTLVHSYGHLNSTTYKNPNKTDRQGHPSSIFHIKKLR